MPFEPREDAGPWPLNGDGVWFQAAAAPSGASRPALFLDRDGVITVDVGFPSDPAAARLLPGAAALIAAANRAGVPVAVVTNQSGIDRGLYGWAEFAAVEARTEALLAAEGASIDGLAACPFHPDFTPGYGAAQARWRKPGAAMLTALAERLGLDPARSWMVGDRTRDIEAARGAGLAGAVIVMTGHGRRDRTAALAVADRTFTVHAAEDAAAAARMLTPLPGPVREDP